MIVKILDEKTKNESEELLIEIFEDDELKFDY